VKKVKVVSLDEEAINFVEEEREKRYLSSFSAALNSLILTLKNFFEVEKLKDANGNKQNKKAIPINEADIDNASSKKIK